MGQNKKRNYRHPEMRHVMESLVGDLMGEDSMANRGGHVHTPQSDVYETGDDIIIIVDLPGVSRDQMEVFIEKGRIIVEAVKRESRAPDNARYHCIERLFGKFERVIDIPCTVHTGKVEAVFDNGVLTVRMPKIKDRRGARIKVPVK